MEKIGNCMLKRIFLTAMFMAVTAGSAFSGDVSIRAVVNKNNVNIDGQIQYSVELSGKSTSLPEVTFPEFDDFYILSGPNSSTSIQWINGNMTSSKSFSFYLKPRKSGDLRIGRASVTVDGELLESEEIIINVDKSSGQPAAPNSSGQKTTTDADIAGENLYLKTNVSKTNVYLGEQIIIEYKLYFKVNVRGYNIDKMPSNAGFWTEEFKMPQQPVIENEIVNGVNYNVAILKEVAVFPTQTGELTIDPMLITMEAVVRSRQSQRGLFDNFFNDALGTTVQKTISSNPVKIKVKPLPESGKPKGFGGAVGQFKFDVSVDKQASNINNAISLKQVLSGVGNIKLTNLPAPAIPPDIEKYEPKIVTDINNSGSIIRGEKKAEYILIPRIAGNYNIKPVSFSYFDPEQKKYITISSKPIELTISGESGQLTAGNGIQQFNRQEVSLLGQDIRFIKENSTFVPIGKKPYMSYLFWISIFSGLMLFIGFSVYNDYQVRLSGNQELARRKKAGRIAGKALADARKKISLENQSEFYRSISQALQGFVQNKLNLELTDFGRQNLEKSLCHKGIADSEIQEYLEVLEESDFRQFANISANNVDKNDLYNRAKSILTKLEKWI
ncbi:MAG: BatD family protein [Calditrichaceae bacterium]